MPSNSITWFTMCQRQVEGGKLSGHAETRVEGPLSVVPEVPRDLPQALGPVDELARQQAIVVEHVVHRVGAARRDRIAQEVVEEADGQAHGIAVRFDGVQFRRYSHARP